MKKPVNPVAITPQPLAGQQLPAEWRKNTQNTGGTYDRRDLSNLWKSPNWTSRASSVADENIIQSARLAP